MTTSTHEVPMTMSKRAALHLRYDTAEDITLQLLLDTEDLPANARSVIGEIVTQEVAQAETRDDETARQNELWDAGTEARYQDELRQMAHDDETRSS